MNPYRRPLPVKLAAIALYASVGLAIISALNDHQSFWRYLPPLLLVTCVFPLLVWFGIVIEGIRAGRNWARICCIVQVVLWAGFALVTGMLDLQYVGGGWRWLLPLLQALLMLAALLAVYSEPGRRWFLPLPPPQPAARRPGNASHDDFVAAMSQRQDKRRH